MLAHAYKLGSVKALQDHDAISLGGEVYAPLGPKPIHPLAKTMQGSLLGAIISALGSAAVARVGGADWNQTGVIAGLSAMGGAASGALGGLYEGTKDRQTYEKLLDRARWVPKRHTITAT